MTEDASTRELREAMIKSADEVEKLHGELNKELARLRLRREGLDQFNRMMDFGTFVLSSAYTAGFFQSGRVLDLFCAVMWGGALALRIYLRLHYFVEDKKIER